MRVKGDSICLKTYVRYGEEDVKVYECIRCGIFFCEECGSVSEKLCILCTSEEEYEDEEEYEEEYEE